MNLRAILFLALPKCFLISKWFTGEDPITISIDPSVVCVGEQVTLSCQLTHSVPSNTCLLWYKKEKERDTPLCFSSSLGGVVEQCHDEEWCRIKGRWERRSLLLIIQQVQVADEGEYVCVVSGSAGSQEAVTHLDVTALGNKPTLERDQQEEGMCRYTCKSKGWNPKPEVLWTKYGGGNKNVEAKTYVTWNKRDLFALQSIMTVPCDDVDVQCVVTLVKEKISRTGSLNGMILQKPNTCMYESRIRGSFVKPKATWVNPQGEDLSSLAQTSILQEKDSVFATESSTEIPCGEPSPSFLTTNVESSLPFAQQSENCDWFWVLYLFCLLLLILIAFVLQIFKYIIWHPFIDTKELQVQGREQGDVEKGEYVQRPDPMPPCMEKPWLDFLEKENGNTVEVNITSALESMRAEVERVLSEKLAVLQSQLEVSQHATQRLEEVTNTQTSLQAISENLLEIDNKLGRTVDRNTTRAIESMRQEVERILSEKLSALQSQLGVSQHAAPPLEELANTQTSLQAISEKMQSLMTFLQNVETSRKQDLEILRAEIQGRRSNDLEAAKRSWSEENQMEIDKKQEELQAQGRAQGDAEKESLKKENELLYAQRYKVDVTLDADTAHPRLQVSEDGKSVTDTGAIRRVPSKEERFDSHAFLLAKEAYASGRLYWEVDVGKRRNWILGVAQETVTRKGKVVLSPQNGFWVIGLADEQDYWAYTDPWTRLTVSGRPQKIGIFLDISAKNLSFYNVHQKNALHTFTFGSSHSQEVKLFPFFSTGPTATKADTEPLQIAQGFDDDEK
ncbi:butyrophilin subfamily 2 member A2-like [Cygnus atratus]|uniref:butyrophilin subfamily 2 member A2-like n=1 Tax=Cygnus atratus TaxID=8868 RepID=UPI0021B7F1A2|nr:butyrophilin subfamily 2 member A2-like [Cygnus atratus]